MELNLSSLKKDTYIIIVFKDLLCGGSECKVFSLKFKQFLTPNTFSVLQMDFLAETSLWSC